MKKEIQPYAESWKFCSIDENMFSTLINKELWFSKPKLFNDPFDCQLDIDAYFDDVEKYLAQSKNDKLNAFREGIKILTKKDLYAYFCTCKAWEHTLMWSHYANNHKGIAMGFSFSAGSPIKTTELIIKPIRYDNSSFNKAITAVNNSSNMYDEYKGTLSDNAKEFYKDFFNSSMHLYEIIRFMKAECWKYEEELRYEVELDENFAGDGILRKFYPSDLKHIIFGLNCNNQNRKTISELLNHSDWKHVKKWACKRNPIDLAVKCEEYKI